MNHNAITLIGRMTRDPESRTTTTGKDLVRFAIAVNKRLKPRDGGPEADFFDVTAWGQTSGYVAQYGRKGRLILVSGRIESRRYQDKDGNDRIAWEVTADNATFLDRADDDAQGGAPKPEPRNRSAAPSSGDDEGYDAFADA